MAITERSVEVHLAEKAALALTGLLLPVAVELLLTLGGRPLPWAMPLAGSLALAVGGFLLPDAMVRSEAAKRRAAFRHALGAFLDLVHLLLAGGAGVEGALADAAKVGHGWAFQQLGRALDIARLTRTSPGRPWDSSVTNWRSMSSPSSPPHSPWPALKAPKSAPRSPPRPPRCATKEAARPRPRPTRQPNG
ncbi:hypothetical protein ACFQ10_13370 [Streptomyces indonesiensis]